MKDKDNKLIFESWQDRAAVTEDEGSEWSSEGLEELEPHELVQFINESLPKFLQTPYDPESYDDVHKALFRAAYTINWELGPEG